MTGFVMPPRVWAGDDADEVAVYEPEVLVSSRDGIEPPTPRGPRPLLRAAEVGGWAARVTYSRCRRNVRPHGRSVRRLDAPEVLEVLCVRLARRPGERGWVFWECIDGRGWGYDMGILVLLDRLEPAIGLRAACAEVARPC